jgi:hypothetical protein
MDNLSKTILGGAWSSIAYPKIAGTCTFEISSVDDRGDKFKIKCSFEYADNSSFRAGAIKTFNLIGVKKESESRIIAQSELDSDPLMLTFSFTGVTFCGFYSMICPIDCGSIRPIESKNQWKLAFGM